MNSIRIFHPSAKKWIKQGFRDFFVLYVSLGLATVGTIGFYIKNWNGLEISRYKTDYMVYRPTDRETRMYPRGYITDQHLLSDDHPEKLEDCEDLPRGTMSLGSSFRRFSFSVK